VLCAFIDLDWLNGLRHLFMLSPTFALDWSKFTIYKEKDFEDRCKQSVGCVLPTAADILDLGDAVCLSLSVCVSACLFVSVLFFCLLSSLPLPRFFFSSLSLLSSPSQGEPILTMALVGLFCFLFVVLIDAHVLRHLCDSCRNNKLRKIQVKTGGEGEGEGEEEEDPEVTQERKRAKEQKDNDNISIQSLKKIYPIDVPGLS
jgi:hypothetical protein